MNKSLIILLFATIPMNASASGNDYANAFLAAGFDDINGQWVSDCGKTSLNEGYLYVPAEIDQVVDLNGDLAPELVLTEGGAYCAGNTGIVSYVMHQNETGQWKRVSKFVGIAEVLDVRGTEGWLDILVSGPGFCFDVRSYKNGKYTFDRTEYDGKPCKF